MGAFFSSEPSEPEAAVEKWSDLFGETLVGTDGKEVSTNTKLTGTKRVAVYFSAHWCPPCRGFTPFLAEFYESVRGEVEDKELEIVFVSSDRDAAGFDSYFKEMPWLALPFSASAIKAKLASRFNVSGIPHFVVLGPDGLTKDANARATVSTFKGDVKTMLAKW